ncbi:MAG: DUF4270 family protein [Bacteroidales bacterium]|nr:DUF4270 family protein [Bacteroidales bacterium]
MNKHFVYAIVAAALLSACDNDENMGTDLMPETDHPIIVVTDTIDIKTETILDNAVFSTNQSHLLVGGFVDPVFGKTDAAFFAKFSNTSYGKFPSECICDSVILTLGLDTTAIQFYGNTSTKNSIDIYTLTSKVYADSSYYSNFNYKDIISDSPIATAEFIPTKTKEEIRFTLPVEFGKKVINCSRNTTFDDNFYGLCFTQGSTSSCILKTSRNNNNIKYRVYYHCKGDTASTAVTFSVASTNACASFFTHDYTGTNIPSDSKSDSLVYLQSMSGTKIKIDLSDIRKFSKFDQKRISIMRADLILPIDSVLSDIKTFAPINQITCLGNNKDGSIIYFEEFLTKDSYGSTSLRSISFESSRCRYNINLTSRVIELLKLYNKNIEPDYDICIYPYARTADFGRTVINAPSKKSSPMKLVIQYTVFEK